MKMKRKKNSIKKKFFNLIFYGKKKKMNNQFYTNNPQPNIIYQPNEMLSFNQNAPLIIPYQPYPNNQQPIYLHFNQNTPQPQFIPLTTFHQPLPSENNQNINDDQLVTSQSPTYANLGIYIYIQQTNS